jgi:hypothetical protein
MQFEQEVDFLYGGNRHKLSAPSGSERNSRATLNCVCPNIHTSAHIRNRL